MCKVKAMTTFLAELDIKRVPLKEAVYGKTKVERECT